MNCYYWSIFPMHGLVWADDETEAANTVRDRLTQMYPNEAEGAMDDIAIYPIYDDVQTEFQMFDS